MTACLVGISSWIRTFGMNRYIAVRLYVRAATVLVSCTTATVFCVLTLWKCKQISRLRKRLTQNVNNTQRSEVRLTMTTMSIITAFVSTELPSIVIIALDAFTFMTGTAVVPGNFAYTLSALNNTLIICATMLNFLIYFYFSQSFRSACFTFWCCKRKREKTYGKSKERGDVRPGDRKPKSSPVSESNHSLSGIATVSTSCASSRQDISLSAIATVSTSCASSRQDISDSVVHL
ncbi:uncharacterized protein [Argopecten irradians]|uniref:uncharacterized protein n=1 Tax=Argopecten irradians TaxID=31199 RepID=UPI00370FD6E4